MTLDYLVDFIENSSSFDNVARLKALLVACGVKPATFIHFRVTPKNLDDKRHFEKHLRELGILFRVSRPKGFEEIRSVRGGTVSWAFKGIWYGYDLFRDKKTLEKFKKYKSLIRQRREKDAAVVGGEVYGYPKCCVKAFIRELDVRSVAKKFSYGKYFRRLHQSDRKFPFIQHLPCSQRCAVSERLNKRYRDALRKCAPSFYRSFTKKTIIKVPLLVNFENDLLYRGGSVWSERKYHDYTAITHDRVDDKYYLVSFLTKDELLEGDLITAELTFQYNSVSVRPGRKLKHFKDVIHKRRMAKL